MFLQKKIKLLLFQYIILKLYGDGIFEWMGVIL